MIETKGLNTISGVYNDFNQSLVWPERYQWLSSLIGMLDDAFVLTLGEQAALAELMGSCLDQLGIPDRGAPTRIPASVYAEYETRHWSQKVIDRSGDNEPTFAAGQDVTPSLESWRTYFVEHITAAYPDMGAHEHGFVNLMFHRLLAALGVPDRKPEKIPARVLTIENTARQLAANHNNVKSR